MWDIVVAKRLCCLNIVRLCEILDGYISLYHCDMNHICLYIVYLAKKLCVIDHKLFNNSELLTVKIIA